MKILHPSNVTHLLCLPHLVHFILHDCFFNTVTVSSHTYISISLVDDLVHVTITCKDISILADILGAMENTCHSDTVANTKRQFCYAR